MKFVCATSLASLFMIFVTLLVQALASDHMHPHVQGFTFLISFGGICLIGLVCMWLLVDQAEKDKEELERSQK